MGPHSCREERPRGHDQEEHNRHLLQPLSSATLLSHSRIAHRGGASVDEGQSKGSVLRAHFEGEGAVFLPLSLNT